MEFQNELSSRKLVVNKAKSKSSLRPRSYTKFKDYIEITNLFQKAHEKIASNSHKYPYNAYMTLARIAVDINIFETMQNRKLTVMRAKCNAKVQYLKAYFLT